MSLRYQHVLEPESSPYVVGTLAHLHYLILGVMESRCKLSSFHNRKVGVLGLSSLAGSD